MSKQRFRRALVAIEPLVIMVVLGALVAFVAIGAGETRRRARVAGSLTNLQQFASGASSFAADNADRVFSFSWHRGEVHVDPDGYAYPPAANDNQAASDQAVSIMRRHAGRTDITIMVGWAPHVRFNYLPLAEYLGVPLPAEFAASPSDHNVLAWQKAGRVPDQGEALLALFRAPNGGSAIKRLAYASSYQVGPAFYSPDALVNTPQGSVLTYAQSPVGHGFYIAGDARTVLGMRRMSEVHHPGNKAMMFERYADDLGARRCFYAYERARTPILCADGSASVRSMFDANTGFDPNNPAIATGVRINYTPDGRWEPPTLNGTASQYVFGRIQWTRSGLRGRDFGGPEVPWVP